MAPIFASPDIAALVAAFPPPLPTKERPSLVKSHSGSNLLDSRKVLANFRILLETTAARIKRADLPARLNVETSDWLLDVYDGEVYYSKDLQCLLPSKETESLQDRLKNQAGAGFVDIAGFASKQDISRQSLDRLLAARIDLRHFSTEDGRRSVAEKRFVESLKDSMLSEINSKEGERIDLASDRSSIPPEILLELTREALRQHGIAGKVSREREKVMYEPADYQDRQDKKRDEELQDKAAAALESLGTNGWCMLRDESGAMDGASPSMQIHRRVLEGTESRDLRTFHLDSTGSRLGTTVMAQGPVVDAAMTAMCESIQDIVQKSQQAEERRLPLNALGDSICTSTESPGLSRFLLESPQHREILESALASALRSVEAAKSQQFTSVCRDILLCPLELYRQGLQTVADETLRPRLDAYICEHFRDEVVSDLVQKATGLGLLQDKGRSKDLEKFRGISAQATTLDDIHSAANKFCRKQKMNTPTADELRKAKLYALRNKFQTVKKMSRASDVLQNVTWILLAQRCDGLFLSGGKDTSRMIKHYQSVGDAEKGRQLEQWRDLLKAGKQSGSDVQDMQTMADDVVASMLPDAEKPV